VHTWFLFQVNVTAKIQVTPGSPFQSVCVNLVDLSCDIESTIRDSRSAYTKRKGKPNKLGMIQFSTNEFQSTRHFCNDEYSDGNLGVLISDVNFESVRDTLWATKNALIDHIDGISIGTSLRCFVTSDVYVFGHFLLRQGHNDPIEQNIVLSSETLNKGAQNRTNANDLRGVLSKILPYSFFAITGSDEAVADDDYTHRIKRFGSVSFNGATFGLDIDMTNISSYLHLDLPPSLKELRIVYPGTTVTFGAGSAARSNW
jgi:hypothetical protein